VSEATDCPGVVGDHCPVNDSPTAGSWRCAICREPHDGLATVFGPNGPDPWASATDEDRARGEINRDMCVLPMGDETHYFVRGELPLPIIDSDNEVFVWAVWVSLSTKNMKKTVEHWEDPDRATLPPMFGWLCNWLAPYEPATTNLAVNVHTRAPGVVPWFELDPTVDHPLVREQTQGVSLHRVAELNRMLLGVDGAQ
jgi:hypothetical protein